MTFLCLNNNFIFSHPNSLSPILPESGIVADIDDVETALELSEEQFYQLKSQPIPSR